MRRQPNAKPVADPIDWHEIAGSVDERGYAITPKLLTRGECRDIAALYSREEVFRNRVIMQRHAFGRGEYQYFKYPLPGAVEALRQAIYPHLAPIANRWRKRLNEEGRFPPSLPPISSNATKPARRGRRPSCSNTGPAITTVCIRISRANWCSRCN